MVILLLANQDLTPLLECDTTKSFQNRIAIQETTQSKNSFIYETKGGFRRRALLALYSTRINYLTLKISKCRLVRLWLD